MAIPRKLPIDFKTVFPFGAYMVGDISPVRDYDRSTKEQVVQALDPDSGLPVWAVDVVDADPDATKSNRTMTVKVAAKVQPVLERPQNGLPFCPVEFEGMTATAYVEDNGNFSRIAWSLRASEVREAGKAPQKPAPEKAVA